jgi:hypothetical protein
MVNDEVRAAGKSALMIAFHQYGQAHQKTLMTQTGLVLTAVLANHVLRGHARAYLCPLIVATRTKDTLANPPGLGEHGNTLLPPTA